MPETLSIVWHALLDLLFPPRCVGCGRLGTWFCPECLAQVQPVPQPTCRLCYEPLTYGDLCRSCRRSPLQIDGIRAVGLHQGPLRRAIHGLKYRRQRDLVLPLAGLLRRYLEANPIPADILVPVPLHPERLRERGFNQAALLARAIATPELPVVEDCLQRTRFTQAQMTLGREERKSNVAGAFICVGDRVRGHKVLLIDDVCTTGATLEACAIALWEAGATAVWGLTLAKEK